MNTTHRITFIDSIGDTEITVIGGQVIDYGDISEVRMPSYDVPEWVVSGMEIVVASKHNKLITAFTIEEMRAEMNTALNNTERYYVFAGRTRND